MESEQEPLPTNPGSDPPPVLTATGEEQEGYDLSAAFPESVRSKRWFRGTLVAVALLGFLLCAGVTNWVMHSVMDSDADRWVSQFRAHPQVVEELGTIDKGGYSLVGTLRETEEETVVYFVNGTKGAGELVVTEFGMIVPRVVLRTKDGKWTLQEGVKGQKPEEEH